jgi:hypothetical protein
MSYIVPKEIPNRCGRCPCFHAERLMYCQAVKADKNKRIYAPYGEGRPDWCPLIEVKTPHGRLGDLDALYEEISNGNKAYNGIEGYDGEYPNIGNVDDCLDTIKYTEAVIEAEE